MVRKSLIIPLVVLHSFSTYSMDSDQQALQQVLETRNISEIQRLSSSIDVNEPILLMHIDSCLVSHRTLTLPLIWAAREGHLEVMKVLCECGADPNKSHKDGITALHELVMKGSIQGVPELFAYGAKPTQTIYGYNPLHLAAQKCWFNSSEKLIAMLVYLGGKEQMDQRDKLEKKTPLEIARCGMDSSPATKLLSDEELLDQKVEELRRELEGNKK